MSKKSRIAGSNRVNAARSFSATASFMDKAGKSMSGTRAFRVKGLSNSVLAFICADGIRIVSRNPTSILMRAADLVSAFVDLHELGEDVIIADRPPSAGGHAGRGQIDAPFQTDIQTGGRYPVEEFPFLFGINIQGGGNFAGGAEFIFPELSIGREVTFQICPACFYSCFTVLSVPSLADELDGK